MGGGNILVRLNIRCGVSQAEEDWLVRSTFSAMRSWTDVLDEYQCVQSVGNVVIGSGA
jgi:hypothetical protein